jgi:hypothetical protein
VAATDTEGQLRWETRQRPAAAIAAAAAAVLIVGSGVATALMFQDAPLSGVLDSLGRTLRPGDAGRLESLRVPAYEFYDARAIGVVLTAVARAAGFVAVAFMLTYLGSAVRARSPAFRRTWIYVALAGGVLGALATVVYTVVHTLRIGSFLDGPRTVDRALDIDDSSLVVTSQLIGIPGTQALGLSSMALGLGWVVVCLHAMRVGLLTRFMGVLGVICGVFVVLPILGPLPIVQTFWLGAMAALLAGRWPKGMPPAWQTGRAEPWPSQGQLRAARARPSSEPEAPQEPAQEPAAAPAGRPHPSSKKRKRKRRG